MLSVTVSDISQVAEARREAVGLAKQNGFDDEAAGRLSIAVTELATNLVKHGGGGRILATAFDEQDGVSGVEIVAIDKGPGISDIGGALADGVSTVGTAGNGLGAIRRQSHAFEIFSQHGQGTVVLARIAAQGAPRKPTTDNLPPWGGVNIPYPGESVSGDGWAVQRDETGCTLMVVDGLGHGPDAARVASEATRLFVRNWRSGPAETLRSLHAGLRATRGGAVAIAHIDKAASKVTYAGVGNIVGAIVSPDGQVKRMMSYNGTIGHNARQILEIGYPIEHANSLVVLHSDGVSGSWSVADYPGLMAQHPAIWAAVLYRDFARGRDDATVLVTKASAA
jgi:anti-sigma regulatory factor (Ser/Thr protein kinase)